MTEFWIYSDGKWFYRYNNKLIETLTSSMNLFKNPYLIVIRSNHRSDRISEGYHTQNSVFTNKHIPYGAYSILLIKQ